MSDLADDSFDLTPAVSPGDFVTVAKRALSIGTGSLLRPYLLIAGIALVAQLIAPLGGLVSNLGLDLRIDILMYVGLALAWGLGILNTIVAVLISGMQIALFRAVRVALVEGPDAVRERGGAIAIARERYGLSLAAGVVFGLIMGVGFLLCVLPGFAVLVLLSMFPFLVAATDTPFGDAFKRSFDLVVKNIATVLILFAALFFAGVLIVGIAVILSALMAFLGALVGGLIGFPATLTAVMQWVASLIFGLVGLGIGYFSFLLTGSLYTLIDARARGEELLLEEA